MQKSAQIPIKINPRHLWRFCIALFITGLFVASCFVTGTPGARALFAFIPVVVLIFAVELNANARNRLRSRERWRIRRATRFAAPLLDGVLNIFLHAILASIALLILVHPQSSDYFLRESLRLCAGATLLYALAAIIATLVTLLFLAAGYSLPIIHRHPVTARSVGEFWARRWNIVVSAWLHTFIFLPLARRRHAGLGILCAFLVSGLFHGWPILAALGAWPAFTTTAFFVIQGVAVLAENWFRIHTWPVPIARAWTVIIILGTSPLFIDPGLRLFGL